MECRKIRLVDKSLLKKTGLYAPPTLHPSLESMGSGHPFIVTTSHGGFAVLTILIIGRGPEFPLQRSTKPSS